MLHHNRVAQVDPGSLPSVLAAYQPYRSLGGNLTELHGFGVDPLEGIEHLKQIRSDLLKKFPTFDSLFSSTVNGDSSPFKQRLMFYIDITKRLSAA